MTTLIIVLIIFFILGSIFLLFSLWSIYTIMKIGVPWAKTPQKNFSKIFSNINIPKNSIIYDLGCGDGKFIFFAESLGYKGRGYELSLYPYLKCLTKKILTGSKIKVKRKNFFNININDADMIYVFLVDTVMEKLRNKLSNDLRPGTTVVSYGFEIPGWKTEKILETNPSKTFFYKI